MARVVVGGIAMWAAAAAAAAAAAGAPAPGASAVEGCTAADNEQCVAIMRARPELDAIAELCATRIGVCELARRGVISDARAGYIFERARARVTGN